MELDFNIPTPAFSVELNLVTKNKRHMKKFYFASGSGKTFKSAISAEEMMFLVYAEY
jgi:hypothetical protein